MPQALALGNGSLQVNIGDDAQVRDFYFPYVGEENHTAFGTMHRVGVWVDGDFRWLSDAGWVREIAYAQDTLVGESTLTHEGLGITLHLHDFVYTTHNAFIRRVRVTNLRDWEREVRLFFSHDFYLYGVKLMDTAQYEPELRGVLHYRRKRYFFVTGRWEDTGQGMNGFSVGKSNYRHHEGTWRDAEDGELSGHSIEQGSVDSTVGFSARLAAQESQTLNVWMACGKNMADVRYIHERILRLTPKIVYEHTAHYWEQWAVHKIDQTDLFPEKAVGQEMLGQMRRSLLILRTQIDNRGAIVASTDSAIMKFNNDNYCYMWPRDGAFVSMSLARAGYFEPVRKYFEHVAGLVTDEGFLYPKYSPDGTLGSNWHPKWKDGQRQLPIQEDSSALILVALWDYYKQSRMIEVAQQHFNGIVLRIGHFLLSYTDEKTALPLPSYDLWEERRGVSTFTASTVYAGLMAAANLSRATGHYENETVFLNGAARMKKAILKHLWDGDTGRFVKKITLENGVITDRDTTVDASIAFVWDLGVLAPDDTRVVSTMRAIKEHLQVRTHVGGLARYTGDYYHRARDHEHEYGEAIPGNPWIITTLWYANWLMATAQSRKDLKESREILEWVTRQTNPAGILPEQMCPFSGVPLSVAPLTWSHSTFVESLIRYGRAWERLGA